MTIEATSKENTDGKHTLLIAPKVGTWELLINYFKKHYGNERIAADNLKLPSLSIVREWVKTAWDSIDSAIITKSFKKCSISNGR